MAKDPRESLRIDANHCMRTFMNFNDTAAYLVDSSGAQPIEKSGKIHVLENKTKNNLL